MSKVISINLHIKCKIEFFFKKIFSFQGHKKLTNVLYNYPEFLKLILIKLKNKSHKSRYFSKKRRRKLN